MDCPENITKYTNPKVNEDDDDHIELPPDTMAILNEFLHNKEKQKSLECEDLFEEDWQLSQFWYDEKTKSLLSQLCSELVLKKQNTAGVECVSVALLSCPTIYRPVKTAMRETNTIVRLFEFDTRFSRFGEDFVHYDYRDVVKIGSFENSFDIVFADPPFLSKECITSMACIIHKIMKYDADLIVCTGKIMEQTIRDTLNLNICEFQPKHQRNLANEFSSFANFDLDALLKCIN